MVFVSPTKKEVRLHDVSIGRAANWSEAIHVLREFGYKLFGPRYAENGPMAQKLGAENDLRKLLDFREFTPAGLAANSTEGPTAFQFHF